MKTDSESVSLDADELEREERRVTKRRDMIDRRVVERRKKYWWGVIFPIIVAVCVSALISWGAYITHVTYTISANYEASFVAHVKDRSTKDKAIDDRFEVLRSDYNTKIEMLHVDLNNGLAEIRKTNLAIYNLLLQHQGGVQPKPVQRDRTERP